MTADERPAPSPEVTGPSEIRTAAKQVSLSQKPTHGRRRFIVEEMREQLAGRVHHADHSTARICGLIPRVYWCEVIVECDGCFGVHRHHVRYTEGRRVTRRVRTSCCANIYDIELPTELVALRLAEQLRWGVVQ